MKITGYPLGENYGNTFRVENGVFKVSYDQYPEFGNTFGHIFYRDRSSRTTSWPRSTGLWASR